MVLLSGLLIGSAPALRAQQPMPISIELDGLADWSTLGAFNDITSIFGPWQDPATFSTISSAQLSLDNYPVLGLRAQSNTYLRAYPGWREGTPGNRPTISYTVTWDGGGLDGNNQAINNISFLNQPVTNFTSTVVEGVRKNSANLLFKYNDHDGEATLTMYVDNSLAGTAVPVSNLHIVPTANINPQTGTAPMYREEFLRKISPFNILRFMDWHQTNGGNLVGGDPHNDPRRVDWVKDPLDPNSVGRPMQSEFNRTRASGVPYEEIITLANVSKKSIWINLPDRASSNFVQGLSGMLASTLHSNADIYVEFSNEIWNSSPRHERVWSDAVADTAGPVPVNDGDANKLRLVYRESAKKLYEYSQVLKTTVPNGTTRVKPILSGLTPTPILTDYAMRYLEERDGGVAGQGRNLSHMIAGIAIAPYVGNDLNEQDLIKTVPAEQGYPVKNRHGKIVGDTNQDSIVDPGENWVYGPDPNGVPQSLDITPTERERYMQAVFPALLSYVDTTLRGWVRDQKAIADKYSVPLLSYEGGQHLVAYNWYYNVNINSILKQEANRDPRMALVYRDLITMWKQETGNQVFNQFSLSRPPDDFGSWGLLEDITQNSTPKWNYFLDLLAGDANLDGKVDLSDFQTLEMNFNKTHTLWGDGDFNLDGVVDYNDFLIFRGKFVPAIPAASAPVEAFASAYAPLPEPGAVGVVMLAGIAGLLRRRRRS